MEPLHGCHDMQAPSTVSSMACHRATESSMIDSK